MRIDIASGLGVMKQQVFFVRNYDLLYLYHMKHFCVTKIKCISYRPNESVYQVFGPELETSTLLYYVPWNI